MTLAPNLLLVAIIGVAMWLNRRHSFQAAVGLIVGLTLVGAIISLFADGVALNTLSHFMFFVPMALAGLLLNRRALYATVTITLTAVLLSPILQTTDLQSADSEALTGAWMIALQFSLVYAIVTLFIDRFGVVLHDALRSLAEQELTQRSSDRALRQTQEALIEGQHFNAAIIDNLPGIFYVIDETGSYAQWNRNLLKTLGYRPDEIIRMTALDLFEGEEREILAQRIDHAFEHGYTTAQANLITKAGDRIPYFITGARVELGGKPYLVGFGVDRCEIDAANAQVRELNEELTQRVDRLDALRQIDRAINHSLNPSFTLDLVLEQITNHLHVDAASILLYDPVTQTLRFNASRGFQRSTLNSAEVRLGQGLTGRVGLTHEPELVNGVDKLMQELTHTAPIKAEKFQGSLAAPLLAKGELLGVLQLFHRSPLNPTEEWMDFAKALATQAAIALDNAKMFQTLSRTNTELRLAYDTTIEGWAKALDLRDEETAGHSQRVTSLTMHLARGMGVPDEDLVHLKRGALLHDIGKMGVPDNILLKPGKLTDDEWNLMKQHTTFARDLLASIPFLQSALDIPYAHHEKWDGSGYPRGLVGGEIPLAARIFAVVDVYDALTSDRPYRKAWSQERALAHIQAGAGTHFDPAVVDAFLELASNRSDPVPL